MIIDAHTHRYPDDVIANPSAFAQSANEVGWLNMISPQDRPSLQGWADRKLCWQTWMRPVSINVFSSGGTGKITKLA